jgi:FtsZ-binding cell division protein ZapB
MVAYAYERPDLRAAEDLETLVRHLLDELGSWRRRCLKAEAELQQARESGGKGSPAPAAVRDRVVQLETENQALRHRVDAARERVQSLVGRLSFLEEQAGGVA